jgi:RES domain-containing protein
MLVWRLTTSSTPDEAFDGAGAALFGGRWNTPGTPVIYTASHLSLAILEILVHAEPDRLKRPYFSFQVTIPDHAIEQVDPALLVPGWHLSPAPARLAEVGSDWARSRRSLALQVPSAVVPHEANFILNCDHSDFAALTIAGGESFRFDHRLLKTA